MVGGKAEVGEGGEVWGQGNEGQQREQGLSLQLLWKAGVGERLKQRPSSSGGAGALEGKPPRKTRRKKRSE